MENQAGMEWMAIFDDQVSKAGYSELPELKRLSMLLFAVKREFSIISNELDHNRNVLQQKIKESMSTKSTAPLIASGVTIKSELFPSYVKETIPSKSSCTSKYTTPPPLVEPNSPELFRNLDLTEHQNDQNEDTASLNSSSDDDNTTLHGSPVIKKKRKSSFRYNDSTPSLCFMPNIEHDKSDIPDVLESSILIANTPDPSHTHQISIGIGKKKLFFSKRKSKANQSKDSNVMKMMSGVEAKLRSKKKGNKENKSNLEDTNDKCELDLTELLDYINDGSGDENHTKDLTNIIPRDKNLVKSKEHNGSLKVQKELNDYLASANNVQCNVEPEPVIRGKARKNLPGWSCKDCERFYMNQGLTPEELLQKMNECSKHRSKYKPREDTFTGFWDLNITQDK